MMYECFHCGNRSLVWGADFDYEEYGIEGRGIVHTLTCAVCGCYVEYYVPIEEIGDGVDLDKEITE